MCLNTCGMWGKVLNLTDPQFLICAAEVRKAEDVAQWWSACSKREALGSVPTTAESKNKNQNGDKVLSLTSQGCGNQIRKQV